MVYLDAASAEPLHPAARQALLAALADGWADPTRLYKEARRARLLLDAAREAAAEVVGVSPEEVTFTSSGTHALHAGIAGVLAGRHRVGDGLVTSAVEHAAVLRHAESHESAGCRVVRVGVDREGRVDAAAFAAAVGEPGTALACLQSANHEVGTVQPVEAVADACDAVGVPLLVDAAQSLGRLSVPAGWSLLAASARKWGGPAGVGLLVARRGTRFRPPVPAVGTEGGRVPGTPDVPSVVAAVAGLRAVRADWADGTLPARLRELTELIRRQVPVLIPDSTVLGPADGRLPHLVAFSCLFVDGEVLLGELDRRGFAVSSGSACVADTVRPSHVLEAMGVLSEGNVRVSLPAATTAREVEAFLRALPEAVAAARGAAESEHLISTAGGPATESVGHGGAETDADAAADDQPTADEPGAEEAAGDEPGADGGARPALVVDALGRRCPYPVIALARRIGEVASGEVVAVLADDEAARHDVPAWCEMRGHEFVGTATIREAPAYLVRRS